MKVLTVDDSPPFLEAVRELIAATPGFRWVGEARSGLEGLAAAERLDPDLILVDVRMPAMDGIETARRLIGTGRRAVVVLISAQDAVDRSRAARDCGAAAIVPKERLTPSLLRRLWSERSPP